MYVERPYSHTLPEKRRLAKPLIQLDLLEPGTNLAAIRDENVRTTQTQLRDGANTLPRREVVKSARARSGALVTSVRGDGP